ncbi:MAG TPA: hypothetical protein VMZ25_04825 [Terriglobales bacterium]|nr:hypothetical protein [Terriglobales bacterium]
MTTLARKDFAGNYYAQGRHVMVIQGSRPAGTEIVLEEAGTNRHGSSLALRIGAADREDSGQEDYYLIQPVFGKSPLRAAIRLMHCDGEELVPTRFVGCQLSAHVTGSSQAFNLDEAFADALRQLPPLRPADTSVPLPLVDLVAMGALYGGFSGFSRLFVRLKSHPEAAIHDRSNLGKTPCRGLDSLPNQQLS